MTNCYKNNCQNNDKKYLNYALNLANKLAGASAPNPTVACVIVKNDIIISCAVTANQGRPHAETIAINKIADKSKIANSTFYITLEPCSHYGKTPPCVDEIIKYKAKKVVIGLIDPDQRVKGNGVKKLQEAGIEVIHGILTKEFEELYQHFVKSRNEKTPYITLKIATSLDGKIATKDFDSKWISCEKSLLFSHYLRSKYDAILVGANTIRKDNPQLTCRINGLENFSPKKIIISQNLKFSFEEKVFKNNSINSTILVTDQNNKNLTELKKWQDQSQLNQVIFCNIKNNTIDLIDALEKICKLGINSILVEGGSETITQFIEQKIADELIWIRNKKIIGNDGIPSIKAIGTKKIKDCIDNFLKTDIINFSEDTIEIFKNKKC